MRKLLIILIVVASLMNLSGCLTKDNKEDLKVELEVPEDLLEDGDKLVADLSLEEQIGQLMIIGFYGDTYSEDLGRLIEDIKPGGLIFFKRNISDYGQIKKLIEDIGKNSSLKLPMFYSLDEEGGNVSRIPREMEKLPQAYDLGKLPDQEIFKAGELLGIQLRDLGFNLNFAPVLDIYSNPQNKIIGKRAFGKDGETVAKASINFNRGLSSSNIIGVGKHFPGHGDTILDSHYDLPRVNYSLEELYSREFIPYIENIGESIEGVMISHILYEKLDSENPASLSHNIITGILRRELGFSGLVFSDDLNMEAISKNMSPAEAGYKFIKAGGDIGLFCHNEDDAYEFIDLVKEGIKKGDIGKEELEERIARIVSLKEAYKIGESSTGKIDLNDINSQIRDLYK